MSANGVWACFFLSVALAIASIAGCTAYTGGIVPPSVACVKAGGDWSGWNGCQKVPAK